MTVDGALDAVLANARQALGDRAPSERTGRVGGRVLTHEGQPCPDVQVRLVPLMPQNAFLVREAVQPGIRTATEALTQEALQRVAADAFALPATSDAQGAFELAVEADRVYSVELKRPGWSFQRVDNKGNQAVNGSELLYTALPLAGIEFDLVDAAGVPLEEAVIAYSPANYGREYWSYLRWSSAEPRLEFEPGSLHLVALSADANPWCPERSALWLSEQRSARQELSLAGSTDPQQLRLEIAPRPLLYGQIFSTGTSRTPLGGFDLALVPPGATSAPRDRRGFPTLRSFASAHYLLTMEEAGSYDLRLQWPGEAQGVLLGSVDLPAGAQRRDFEAPAMAEQPRILFVVRAPDGSPVASLGRVECWRRDPSGMTSGGGGGDLRPVGVGRFELVAEQMLAPWLRDEAQGTDSGVQAGVQIEHLEYGSKSIDLVHGQREYLVQFEPTAALTIEVSGAAPAEPGYFYSAQLTPITTGSGDVGLRPEQIDVDISPTGTFRQRLDRLHPGTYSLELGYNQGTRNSSYFPSVLISRSVNLTPGENRARLDLGELVELLVRHPSGSGKRIALYPRSPNQSVSNQQSADVDQTGLARFSRVAPGDYVLTDGTGFMSVTCPTGEIMFQPVPADCLDLLLAFGGGPLFEAGLRSGDRIESLDGQPYTKERWNARVGKTIPTSELTLTVRRGEQTLELRCSNRVFDASGRNGFWRDFLRP
jgi:hypothetical protein